MYEADEAAQRGAFRGRLKHFKRLGIPLDRPIGRGRKVPFDTDHIFQWTLCLELSEFGIDPAVTVKFLRQFWTTLQGAFIFAKDRQGEYDILLLINPAVMSKTWWKDPGDEPLRSQYPEFVHFGIAGDPETSSITDRLKEVRRRAMIINMSEVVRLIERHSLALGVTG